jgi:pimeloyl-ACP methyl ester carboxylesterase
LLLHQEVAAGHAVHGGAQGVGHVARATVHRVPGGHFLMQEQPDAVLAAMRNALA